MHARTLRRVGIAAAGLAASVMTLSGPAFSAGAGTIHVPSDFAPTLSDTRASGHYEVVGTGLRVWTDSTSAPAPTDQRKVAEYVFTNTPLADVGEPSLDYTNTSGTIPPGFQLQTDFDGDGTIDGILVGEPTYYGNDWWLNNSAKQFVKDSAPSHATGSGSANHGTLDQWRAAFPNAVVEAYGFSLGSGVTGDWTINAIDFAGTRYTFVKDVKLTSKDQCKNGGWATSTQPVFKNQGDCVSSFASAK